MIIIGHKEIEHESIVEIKSQTDLERSASNSTVFFDYDLSLCKYASKNGINFAVRVSSQKEVIFSSTFLARYIVCEGDLALDAQKFADDYVIDSKILKIIKSEEEIVDTARDGIDGVWII